jgi:thioesterase domain-containing protein
MIQVTRKRSGMIPCVDNLLLVKVPETDYQHVNMPRDDSLIIALTPIWERVLRRSPIRADENFFDLGGDPKLAAHLFSEISHALRRDLPITMLYDAPTIATLAKALEREDVVRTSALVQLAGGEVAPPVFFLHGLGGTLIEFAPLVRHIRSSHPIYGIQARGLNPGDTPADCVEAMAQHCVEAMAEVQRQGPYYLVGNSSGGLVALETARQLSERGERIALLVLLDTYPYARYWPLEAWLSVLWRRAMHHASVLRRLGWQELPPYIRQRWRRLRDHLRSRAGKHFQAPASDDEVIPPALRRLRERTIAAFASYRPRHYPDKITFFKPDVATLLPADPRTVWKRFAEEIEIHSIPGDHVGISTVYADILAAELRRCIEGASTQDQNRTTCIGVGVRSREMVASDIEVVAELLGKGLGYSPAYFRGLLEVMRERDPPAGCPKFGYVLEDGRAVVGAILLIFSKVGWGGHETIRCHVTSWSVESKYRPYAALFYAKALKRKDVIFLNLSARPSTVPIIEVQGFAKYSNGQFLAIPLLQFGTRQDPATVVPFGGRAGGRFEPEEFDLLAAHDKFGCICLWCTTGDRAFPFVFRERVFKGLLPGVQLIYCNDIEEFVRFARPIGAYLARRGRFFVRMDANGPISGLVGRYFDGLEQRYFRGPKPRLGDLAFTQPAMRPHARRKF